MCTDTQATAVNKPEAGKFVLLPQMMEVSFSNGITVVAPGDTPVSARLGIDAGTIIDTVCKLLKVCGGSGGGGGCYKIVGPDGTVITICPGKASLAMG